LALTFYYGAGSPYAWRVWFALEHKALPYDRKVLSFTDGDLKKPDYLAINPRGKVPTIVDGELRLHESAAILEYLDDAHPDSGERLFPGALRDRALVRRLVCEADNYFVAPMNRLLQRVLFAKREEWDAARIAAARDEVAAELARWSEPVGGGYLAGRLSAADFTLYPMIAISLRCEKRKPDLGLRERIPAPLVAWMARIEALPFFATTYPPNWK
jgi:glutathione S-transferase